MVNYEKALSNFKEYLEKQNQEDLELDSLNTLLTDMISTEVGIIKIVFDKLEQAQVSKEVVDDINDFIQEFYVTAMTLGMVKFVKQMVCDESDEKGGDKVE